MFLSCRKVPYTDSLHISLGLFCFTHPTHFPVFPSSCEVTVHTCVGSNKHLPKQQSPCKRHHCRLLNQDIVMPATALHQRYYTSGHIPSSSALLSLQQMKNNELAINNLNTHHLVSVWLSFKNFSFTCKWFCAMYINMVVTYLRLLLFLASVFCYNAKKSTQFTKKQCSLIQLPYPLHFDTLCLTQFKCR